MTQMVPIYDIWRILSYPREHVEAEIRALCRTAYVGDHSALCRILGRYKIYVDTRDVGIARDIDIRALDRHGVSRLDHQVGGLFRLWLGRSWRHAHQNRRADSAQNAN